MADDVQITVGVALDQLNQNVNAAIGKFGEMKAAIVDLMAAGGLTALVSSLADLGEQAERSAAILGVSTVAAQELGVIAQVSGGSLEGITTQLTRLQVGLERGSKETSIQANALKALGISAQQFIATPVNKQVDLFADAVKRLSDQGKNAAPALALISRGLAALMPELELGSKGMEELRQRAIDVGAVVSKETTTAMADLHRQLVLAWEALKGFGQTLLAALPSVTQFAKEIADAAGRLSALVATGQLLPSLWEEFKLRLERTKDTLTGNSAGVADVDRRLALLNTTMDETVKHYHDLVKAQEDLNTKTSVPVSIGPNAERIKEAEEEFRKQSELIKQAYNEYTISEREKTARLIEEVNRRKAAEILAGENVKVATAKADADIAKLNADASKKVMDEWKSVADRFASDFSSAIDQVLTKQESFGQAMVQMMGKMVEQMIAYIIKLIAEYAILNAAALTYDILTGGSGIAFGAAVNAGAPAGASGPSIAGLIGHAAGTPFIENTGIAMLHEGEAVIPAEGNPFGSGGGTNNTFTGGNMALNINAMDAASFVSMLRRNPNAFASLFDRLSQRSSLATLLR